MINGELCGVINYFCTFTFGHCGGGAAGSHGSTCVGVAYCTYSQLHTLKSEVKEINYFCIRNGVFVEKELVKEMCCPMIVITVLDV